MLVGEKVKGDWAKSRVLKPVNSAMQNAFFGIRRTEKSFGEIGYVGK